MLTRWYVSGVCPKRDMYVVHAVSASGRMSLAKTVVKLVRFSSTQSFFTVCLISGESVGNDLALAMKPPSNPKSMPPQPENNDKTLCLLPFSVVSAEGKLIGSCMSDRKSDFSYGHNSPRPQSLQ